VHLPTVATGVCADVGKEYSAKMAPVLGLAVAVGKSAVDVGPVEEEGAARFVPAPFGRSNLALAKEMTTVGLCIHFGYMCSDSVFEVVAYMAGYTTAIEEDLAVNHEKMWIAVHGSIGDTSVAVGIADLAVGIAAHTVEVADPVARTALDSWNGHFVAGY